MRYETTTTAGLEVPARTPDHSQRRAQAEVLGRIRRARFLRETALSLALPLLAWVTGVSSGLADWFGVGARPPSDLDVAGWLGVFALIAGLLIAYRLVLLPLDYLSGYRVSRRFGLTTQSPGDWARDWLKVTGLALLFGEVVGLGFYGSLALLGATWWIGFGVLLSGGLLLLTYAMPYVLLPLFFRLRPLDRGPLTERIDAVFARARVARPRIEKIDLSSRTTAANAAVIGVGGSRRVVLGDTLLAEFTLDEIEAVVAHELGHHVRADVSRGLGLELALLWLGLLLAAVALDPLFAGSALDWRAPVALPLLALLAEAASLAALPVHNAFSRHVERTADRYALDLTGQPAAFAAAMQRLADQNLVELQPPRWAEWLLGSHPSVAQRIRLAEDYARA